MPETNIVGEYRVGISRLKYLDICNLKFIATDMDGAKQAIDSFLNTIKAGTPVEKEIQKNIDIIEEKKTRLHKELRAEIDKKGFLEQSIGWNDGHAQIDIEALLDLKAVCWAVALEHGLFNE